jgi:hypothetical protein
MSTRRITDHEAAAVLALDASARYAHFIKQVADSEVVWGLQDSEGWISLVDDAGAELLPVWPHERYAQLFSTDRYPTAMALPIPLDEWLDNWLSNLEEDGCQVAVFPTPSGTGAAVDAARMRTDLEAELENYA